MIITKTRPMRTCVACGKQHGRQRADLLEGVKSWHTLANGQRVVSDRPLVLLAYNEEVDFKDIPYINRVVAAEIAMRPTHGLVEWSWFCVECHDKSLDSKELPKDLETGEEILIAPRTQAERVKLMEEAFSLPASSGASDV